jgi:hypothetical protein
MSAVVTVSPRSLSPEGDGLVEGDMGEEEDGLVVILWRNNDCFQCASCNTDNGTYGFPVRGDVSREIVMMSSSD